MKRPLLIRIAKGSITDVKATAIVVTHFQGIEPGGAELAVDDAIEGAITAFTKIKALQENSAVSSLYLPSQAGFMLRWL